MHKFSSCMKSVFHKMNQNKSKGVKVKCFMVFTLSLFGLLFLMGPVFHMFYINETASAPRGIYLKLAGTPSKGDYVILSCPKEYPPLTYPGMLLLKKIRGFPGEVYTVADDTLTLNEVNYPIFHLEYLPQLDTGTFSIPPGMYLFLNDMPYSFDSRYMGPISHTQIISRVILLLDYDHLNVLYQKYIGGTQNYE